MGSGEVALRDVEERDLPLFYEIQADPEGAALAAYASKDRDAHLAHWHKILADDSCAARTVTFGGEVVGSVQSWEGDGHREIGYWIGREHWGRGIATAAVARYLEIERTRPLMGWVAEHNLGSIRVLEKCGFARSVEQPEPVPDEVRFVVLELHS